MDGLVLPHLAVPLVPYPADTVPQQPCPHHPYPRCPRPQAGHGEVSTRNWFGILFNVMLVFLLAWAILSAVLIKACTDRGECQS